MTQDDRMETITDPAAIRACDEPDERGDFPCCTTPAPVGAAVALDLDRIADGARMGFKATPDLTAALVAEVRRLAGIEAHRFDQHERECILPDERTTPAPVGAAVALDLDAIEARQKAAASARWEIIGDRDGPRALMALLGEDVPALVAEVRRLTAIDDDLSWQIHETGGLLERAQAAEAAEAEVVTLRARLAAVEAVHVRCGEGVCNAGPRPEICHECGVAWPCPTFAALAVTTGEGE